MSATSMLDFIVADPFIKSANRDLPEDQWDSLHLSDPYGSHADKRPLSSLLYDPEGAEYKIDQSLTPKGV